MKKEDEKTWEMIFRQILCKEILDETKTIYSTCVSIKTLDESPMTYERSEDIIQAIEPTATVTDYLKPEYNFKSEKKIMKKIPQEIKENFVFDKVSFFRENDVAIVYKDNWCGELNSNGVLINKFICKDLWKYDNHYLICFDKKHGLIDLNGNFVIDPIYDSINYINNDLWIVSTNDKSGVFDISKNKMIIDFKYDNIEYDSPNNVLIVIKNEKMGIIDLDENIIIPSIYDLLYFYSDKKPYLSAKKDEKIGIIDINNKTIIPFEYKSIFETDNGLYVVENQKENYFIINSKNERVCTKNFQYIIPICFANGLYLAKFNDLYGIIDKFGNTKVDFKYTDATYHGGYYAIVSTDKCLYDKEVYGLIDENGKLILPCEYKEYSISEITANRIVIEKNCKFGIKDDKNNTIVKLKYDFIDCLNFGTLNYYSATIGEKSGFIDVMNGKPLKIDKKSLDIPAIKLDYSKLGIKEQMKLIFT